MQEISRQFPVWFCDIWGVVHNGVAPFHTTVDCLCQHRARGGIVILVSNSPRSTIGVSRQLDEIGVTRAAYDVAVTSGDVTRALMVQQAGRNLFHLGPQRDLSIFTGLDVERVPLEQAQAVICTGLFHDDRETPADYADLLADIKGRGLTMICANPDKVARKGDRLQYCAGALAEAYQAMGGEVLMAGKPHGPIYGLAHAEAERIRGAAVDRHEILAIGDGPETDIRGADSQNYACLFVTGLHDGPVQSLAEAHAAITAAFPDAEILRTVDQLVWS